MTLWVYLKSKNVSWLLLSFYNIGLDAYNPKHKGLKLKSLGQIIALSDNVCGYKGDSISCYVKHGSVLATLNANNDCGW